MSLRASKGCCLDERKRVVVDLGDIGIAWRLDQERQPIVNEMSLWNSEDKQVFTPHYTSRPSRRGCAGSLCSCGLNLAVPQTCSALSVPGKFALNFGDARLGKQERQGFFGWNHL